jgi:hypothetical protein
MCNWKLNSTTCHFDDCISDLASKMKIYDDDGFCWFHSKDLVWKESDANKEIIKYFIYYSSGLLNKILDLSTSILPSWISLVFAEADLIQDFKFNDCVVNGKLSIKREDPISSVEINNTNILSDLSFNSIVINGINLMNSKINGDIFISKVVVKSFLLFDKLSIGGGIIARSNKFNRITNITNCKINTDPSKLRNTYIDDSIFDTSFNFNDCVVHKAFVINNCKFSGASFFISSDFQCLEGNPLYAAVHFKDLTISKNASISFIGKQNQIIFDNSGEVIFEGIENQGQIRFEYTNILKIDVGARDEFIEKSKDVSPYVVIGRGCVKYINQSPVLEIKVDEENQDLVLDICNTFSKFYRNSNSYNLGIEITHRDDKHVKYYYFSDEPIPFEEFMSKLSAEESRMWKIVRVENQNLMIDGGDSEVKVDFRDKMILFSDIAIDLTGIILKLATRLPLGKLTKEEASKILNSGRFNQDISRLDSFTTLNVQQTILLGINSTQTIGK